MKKRLFEGLKEGERGFVYKTGPSFTTTTAVTPVTTPIAPVTTVTVVTTTDAVTTVILPPFSFVKSMDEVYGRGRK